ncbi:MAG: alpha-(1-_3)-arabinofuranosyltransferase domain-containing protein, partial [Thermoproteota archaeon]
SNVNPPAVACIYFVLFFYFLFYLIFIRTNVLRAVRFMLVTFFIIISLNMWWFLPFLSNVVATYGTSPPYENWSIFNSRPIYDVFRLIGGWAWRAGYLGSPYFPYADYYYEPFLVILTYSLIILLFLAILMKPKNHYILFFNILAIIGIFLAKGVQEPFGNFYFFLFKNFPLFWIFREPFAKFTPLVVLSYSVLLGISTDVIFEKLKNQKLVRCGNTIIDIFYAMLVLTILISSFPLITGDVFPKRTPEDPLSSVHVIVPNYWNQLSNWLNNNDPNARIFLTPRAGYGATYKWKYRFSGDPPMVLLQNPIIEYKSLPSTSPTDLFVNKVYDCIDMNSSRIVVFLALLNVQYVLQQNDFDWKLMPPYKYSPEYMRNFFQSQKGLSLVKTFGELDLYSIDDSYLLPHIYATSQFVVIMNLSDMFNRIEKESFNSNKPFPVFIVYNNGCKLGHCESNDIYRPVIFFKKVNPTKYVVYVNATKPLFLVLSESYNPQWRVFVEDNSVDFNRIAEYSRVNEKELDYSYEFTPQDIVYLFRKPSLNETYHFVANGYANAWYIDPKKIDKNSDGEFTITIYFWPQSLFYLGLIVSGITFVACVSYLLADWRLQKSLLKV